VLGGATACTHAPQGRIAFMQSFLFGTLGDRQLDMRDLCPTGRAVRVAVEPTPATALTGILTLGLYTPREVVVTCAELP